MNDSSGIFDLDGILLERDSFVFSFSSSRRKTIKISKRRGFLIEIFYQKLVSRNASLWLFNFS